MTWVSLVTPTAGREDDDEASSVKLAGWNVLGR